MVVGSSETVKPVSMTMVKKLMGEVFGDFVKEDVSYTMTAPAKRLFAMMYLGNYTEGVWMLPYGPSQEMRRSRGP